MNGKIRVSHRRKRMDFHILTRKGVHEGPFVFMSCSFSVFCTSIATKRLLFLDHAGAEQGLPHSLIDDMHSKRK